MAANGISRLSTKQLKQEGKLAIASAKRQGKIVARDGTITGSADPTKPYYRSRAFYDITQLPTQYSGNSIIDNPNPDGLILGRPWISISYSISPNASAVNEGDTITYTITTVGVTDGTTLYWTNSGTTVGADFTGSANSGSFTVNSGTATFTRVLANDYLTEGAETVIVDIRTGSTSGPIVATSGTVSVADTSIPVVDQYGYFEQQLVGGTYMTFDQTIAGNSLRFICTNFDGNPIYGSYIRVNGVMVATDHTRSPDNFDNSAVGGSAQFGSSKYLSIDTTPAFGFGTGDFTFEGWYYHTAGGANHRLFDFRTTEPQVAPMLGISSADAIYLFVNGANRIIGSTLALNTWTHIAVVKRNNATKLYINGTAAATTYTDTNDYGTTNQLHIGADFNHANFYVGSMTSIRVVNGTAVYTANFTPSVNPLLPVTNTKLLLTELTSGDLLKDTSPSNLIITNTGSVTWTSASPFTAGSPTTLPAPSDPPTNNGLGFCMRRGHTVVALNSDGTVQSTNWYDTYNTVGLGTTIAALLRSFLPGTIVAIGTFDATGMNQDFRDCLTNYFGDTTFSNTWGGSRISQMFLAIVKKKILAFNGSSNRIQVGGTRADWNLSTTWTIEFWSKAAVGSSASTLLTPLSQQPNSGTIDIIYYNGNLSVNNGTTLCAEPTPGVWTHVAISSAAGVVKVFYNGVSQYSGTVNYSLADTANDLWIGRRGNNDFQYFNGKLTNIRISNVARYSTTFTAPLTLITDANTKLALDGNLVDRSASAHTITNTGTSTSSLDFPT
jgi:hypothetical protein